MNDPMLDLEARRLSVAFAIQEETGDNLARAREIYAFLSNNEEASK